MGKTNIKDWERNFGLVELYDCISENYKNVLKLYKNCKTLKGTFMNEVMELGENGYSSFVYSFFCLKY